MVRRIRRAARTIKSYWFATLITLVFAVILSMLIVNRISELESVSNIAQLNPLISQSRGGLNVVDNQGKSVDAIKIDKSKNDDDLNSTTTKNKRASAPGGGSSSSSSQPSSSRPKFDVTITPIRYETKSECILGMKLGLGLLDSITCQDSYSVYTTLTPHNPPGGITYQWKIADWGHDDYRSESQQEHTFDEYGGKKISQTFPAGDKNDEFEVVLEVRSKSSGKLIARDSKHMVWKTPS